MKVIDAFNLDGTVVGGRPISERHAAAILRLKQPHCLVRKVEFDVELGEEVLTEDEANAGTEVPFASGVDAPAPTRGPANLELIDRNHLHDGAPADTEG